MVGNKERALTDADGLRHSSGWAKKKAVGLESTVEYGVMTYSRRWRVRVKAVIIVGHNHNNAVSLVPAYCFYHTCHHNEYPKKKGKLNVTQKFNDIMGSPPIFNQTKASRSNKAAWPKFDTTTLFIDDHKNVIV
jgi:hypothetical protein